MNFKDCFTILCVLYSSIFFVYGHSQSIPRWKQLLKDYRTWTGYYQIYNRPHSCNLYIHSVQYNSDGVAYMSFKTDGVVMDMNALSYDDQVVTMKKLTSYNHTDLFPVHQHFQAVGIFTKVGSVWKYVANITEPEGKGFQTLNLHAMSDETRDSGSLSTKKDRSQSLGLAIGIPVTLAVLLMIAGIAIGIWAIKKGYLRHVPRAYKNFRNQSETSQVSFEGNEQTNVHI